MVSALTCPSCDLPESLYLHISTLLVVSLVDLSKNVIKINCDTCYEHSLI